MSIPQAKVEIHVEDFGKDDGFVVVTVVTDRAAKWFADNHSKYGNVFKREVQRSFYNIYPNYSREEVIKYIRTMGE